MFFVSSIRDKISSVTSAKFPTVKENLARTTFCRATTAYKSGILSKDRLFLYVFEIKNSSVSHWFSKRRLCSLASKRPKILVQKDNKGIYFSKTSWFFIFYESLVERSNYQSQSYLSLGIGPILIVVQVCLIKSI